MSQVEQARKSLLENALNEVRNTPPYSNFYLHTCYAEHKNNKPT